MPIVYMTLPGNFLLALLLTRTFTLGETMFGVIVSLPHWCNVAQLVLMPLLTRRWSQKRIALTFSWLHLCVWIGLGFALPYVPRDDMQRAGRMLFLIFGLSALFHAMVGVAWTSWVQEWVPGRLRGKYFGRRNRLLQLSTVAFLLLAGETMTRLADNPVAGFQVLVGVSVFLRLFSILAQQRILGSSDIRPHDGGGDLRAQFRAVLKNRPLLWLFAFGAAFGLLTNFFGAFFNVYMYDALGQSVADVAMLTVITNATGALALPTWGQLMDRFGNRPTMNVALAAWIAPGFLWALLTPDNSWLLKFLYASGGIFQAGYVLGSFNLLLKLVPPEAKTAAISLNVAVTSVTAAIAPIIGGLVLDQMWRHGIDKLTGYHWMSVAHHFLVLLTGLVLLRVSEPASAPLAQVVGAMRSFRQVFALLGLSFLVNYVFTKTEEPPPRRSK